MIDQCEGFDGEDGCDVAVADREQVVAIDKAVRGRLSLLVDLLIPATPAGE